jgi:hypothetical protein
MYWEKLIMSLLACSSGLRHILLGTGDTNLCWFVQRGQKWLWPIVVECLGREVAAGDDGMNNHCLLIQIKKEVHVGTTDHVTTVQTSNQGCNHARQW